jgi:hypothetical protein
MYILRLCLSMLFLSSVLAFAVPPHVNYQGYLTDDAGNSLDTTVSMTFTIYDGPDESAFALWTENHAGVTIVDGIFSVLLEGLSPNFFTGNNRWLGVAVGADTEMSPRHPLSSVPYAYRVGTIDGAAGGDITGDVAISGKCNIGTGNTNTGTQAFVTGTNNFADGNYSVVGGGFLNGTVGAYASVGGGHSNRAIAYISTVGGGFSNVAFDSCAGVAGGAWNGASGPYSFIGGGGGPSSGFGNAASGRQSVVAGGAANHAMESFATVGGGFDCNARDTASTVAGGYSNHAVDLNSSIGGGRNNECSGDNAHIGGWPFQQHERNLRYSQRRLSKQRLCGIYRHRRRLSKLGNCSRRNRCGRILQ